MLYWICIHIFNRNIETLGAIYITKKGNKINSEGHLESTILIVKIKFLVNLPDNKLIYQLDQGSFITNYFLLVYKCLLHSSKPNMVVFLQDMWDPSDINIDIALI